MPSHILVAALLLAVAGAGAVAQAQSVAAPPLPAQPEVRQANRPGDRTCIRDTGSLIRVKKGQCLPVAGRSYNQQDLQRTGEPNLGSALQKLDPAITARGH